jgi:hypothetical protein
MPRGFVTFFGVNVAEIYGLTNDNVTKGMGQVSP